ncbi:hypothetical protein KC318_g1833 [Hortaea werneckii]|nr:hypothetical protein KC334_g1698 [Hortaea werneckii]KAI7021652.1 hypothetical protein KC355_g2288 [Hortaea werneckii]KAI7674063.1 hypothetical protein KC318_g1833 [Hortaea werneckii]
MAYVYPIKIGYASRDSGFQIYHLVPRNVEKSGRPETPPPDESIEGTVLERTPSPPVRPDTPERLLVSPGRKAETQRARRANGLKRLKGPEAGTRPSKAATGKRKREEDPVGCAVEEDAEMEDAEFEADVEMVEAMEAMGAVGEVEVEENGKVGEVGAGREKGGPKKQARLSFAKSA